MQKIILTVGPALGQQIPLQSVHTAKNIYRINGAHGSVADIEQTIVRIREQIPDAEILLDLPGNKIRTANITEPIAVKKGETFTLRSDQFNYPQYYQHIAPGMTVWANDSTFEFIVQEVSAEKITFLSKSDGWLLNNKGMHIRGIHEHIPYLFTKDKALIALCNQYQLTYVGLSFVRKPENIQEVLELLNGPTQVISKIETLDAVNHLHDILQLVEYILIDRGDLSTEVDLVKVPRFQKYIIDTAGYNNVKVFIATQVLKNMEEKPIPTIAEIDALYNLLKMGVYGIQMSEETAVGQYVPECVRLLESMHQEVSSEYITL